MYKKCPECGKFMKLTDLLPDDDDFDMKLAVECGMTPEQERDAVFDIDGNWSRFHYVHDVWECADCHLHMLHTEGPRYYWNPRTGNYDGKKPLTPKEKAIQQRERQEAAGQMRLFGSEL